MLTSTLIATATAPLQWSPTIGIIMILANIFAMTVGRFKIQYPYSGPELPASKFFAGFGLPAVLATLCFGHILGTGVILGLHYIGRF